MEFFFIHLKIEVFIYLWLRSLSLQAEKYTLHWTLWRVTQDFIHVKAAFVLFYTAALLDEVLFSHRDYDRFKLILAYYMHWTETSYIPDCYIIEATEQNVHIWENIYIREYCFTFSNTKLQKLFWQRNNFNKEMYKFNSTLCSY